MAKKSTGNRTATGVAALANLYYDKAVIANLKANTAFGTWNWKCACGQPVAHRATIAHTNRRFKRQKRTLIPLCEGCNFRFTVMKAAGRADEFVRAYDKQRDAREKETIDILKHNPLPAKTGKTIQMYQYNTLTGVTKPKP